MRLCIAGSRGIYGEEAREIVRQAVAAAMNKFGCTMDDVDEIVSGMCPNSPDMIAVEGATRANIKLKPFPANWDDIGIKGAAIRTRRDGTQYNIKAGIQRNSDMAKYLSKGKDSLCVIVWDGESTGSKDMASACKLYGVNHLVWDVTKNGPV